MQLTNKTPAEVLQDQGRGAQEDVDACTNDSNNRAAKRKLKNFWFEGDRRFLCSYGASGSTVFDIWKWTGEPPPRRVSHGG